MGCSPRAIASFLTFRWLVDPELEWLPGVRPRFPSTSQAPRTPVRTSADVDAALSGLVEKAPPATGILLSGGIDSAILAASMPTGAHAFTIEFVAEGAASEAPMAARFAAARGLEHHVVRVGWDAFVEHTPALARHKQAPLHPVEVGLFVASRAARDLGIENLVVGNGADSNFGGLDQLLSRDWTLDVFEERYTFVDPRVAMRAPASLRDVYTRFIGDGGFVDLPAFLRDVHGPGITQAFDNALGAAGVAMIEPYERLRLDVPLDLARVRAGESKYILRELFAKRYPGLAVPDKLAFVRPMDRWLADWGGPARPELVPDVSRASGEQRWLLYALERFIDDLERS